MVWIGSKRWAIISKQLSQLVGLHVDDMWKTCGRHVDDMLMGLGGLDVIELDGCDWI